MIKIFLLTNSITTLTPNYDIFNERLHSCESCGTFQRTIESVKNQDMVNLEGN